MELQIADIVTLRRVWLLWFIPEIESNSAHVTWSSVWWFSHGRLGPEPRRGGESYFALS